MTTAEKLPGLRRHLYALSFIDEIGPLYAIYPLLMADIGLSIAEISVVFIVWGATELLCEVPSGALADLVDRRHLNALALGIQMVGIGVWLVWPTFSGVLIGAVLWAVHSALASGAWEALVYDELSALDAAPSYPTVMARMEQASHLATALGMLSAAGLVSLGVSLEGLALMTVAICVPTMVLVLALPAVRSEEEPDAVDAGAGLGFRAWGSVLRRGLRDARSTPRVRRLVGLGALLGGLFIVDEYVHLLARLRGVPEAAIPLVVAAVWVGLLLGSEFAARRPRLSPAVLGALLVIGAGVTAAGLLSESGWPLLLLAVGYGAMQTSYVLSDARLQACIPSSTRATVTSVRALGSGLISVVGLALIGALAVGEDPTRGLLVVVGLLGAAGLAVGAWVPAAADVNLNHDDDDGDDG